MVKYFKKLGILPFYAFSNTLNNQVTANAVTWGIPATKATELDDAFNVYKPYLDAILVKKQRTQQQVDDHREQRTVFEDFIEPFANQYIIPNPLISNSQSETLGFNRKQEAGSRPAIGTAPNLNLNAMQGSRIEVENRVDNDQSRPSRHPDCDAVEVRYYLSAPAGGSTPTTPTTPASGTATPVYTTKLSKKAKFILQLAASDSGKVITMQARWINLTDETKNGPWSNPATTMVTW